MPDRSLEELTRREEQSRLSKEQLLRPRMLEEDVPVAPLGGTVKMRTLSHRKRKEIQDESHYGKEDFDEDKMTMLSIVASVIEPDLTMADVEKLKDQDYAIIDALSTQIAFLNMFGETEELKKESEGTPTSDSPSS